MTKAILISFLCYAISFSFEGPDLMLLGPDYVFEDKSINLVGTDSTGNGISASAAQASLYGIKSLDWTYVASRITKKGWSSAITFRSYGIKDIYMSSKYSIYLGKSVSRFLLVGLSYSHLTKTYGNNLYKSADDIFSIGLGLRYSELNLRAQIDNLKFDNSGDIPDNKPEIIIAGNWQTEKSFSIYALLYNDPRDHSRLILGQNLELHNSANLIAGIISGPELYFAGIEMVYKRIVFGYTYFDVGGLGDCSKLTVTYR
ncbi:MAG: hypothetical protein GY839_13495 [candidate division Zixibacteria bacterium]|nr:hypothetical protein [candidate division Zixibacteria bacterium]